LFSAHASARRWGERQRLIAEGMVRDGTYTVADAVMDYLTEIAAEKGPTAVRDAKYIFDASILPDLGTAQLEKLSADRLTRWRNKLATQPKRVRTKRTATEPATREVADDEDARRARKATANRILTMLKAALNRPLDEASERAKILPPVNFHILRHTHGSHLAMSGVPMGVVAAQLGHADTRTCEKHYAHLAPSYVAQTIRANFPVLNLVEGSQVVPLRRRVTT
jgi:Phage integrase family